MSFHKSFFFFHGYILNLIGLKKGPNKTKNKFGNICSDRIGKVSCFSYNPMLRRSLYLSADQLSSEFLKNISVRKNWLQPNSLKNFSIIKWYRIFFSKISSPIFVGLPVLLLYVIKIKSYLICTFKMADYVSRYVKKYAMYIGMHLHICLVHFIT